MAQASYAGRLPGRSLGVVGPVEAAADVEPLRTLSRQGGQLVRVGVDADP